VVALDGSIQEQEKYSGAVEVLKPEDKTKFRLTLEPIMMLLLLGVNVSSKSFVILLIRAQKFMH